MGQPAVISTHGAESFPVAAAIYGFVPNLFQSLAALRPSVEAVEGLIRAILVSGKATETASRFQIVKTVAAVLQNAYVFALHEKGGGHLSLHPALSAFAGKLSRFGPCVSQQDMDGLRAAGLDDLTILEVVATAALGCMLCTLAAGIDPALDAELAGCASLPAPEPVSVPAWNETATPYLQWNTSLPGDFPPCMLLRDQLGFVPRLFAAQAPRPELIQAEVRALELILFSEDHLSRVQKESIMLLISARNLSTYGVALHSQVLEILGISREESSQMVEDLQISSVPARDKTLLLQVAQLSACTLSRREPFTPDSLADQGFSGRQILEASATAALANFLNTLQFGLGVAPDFPPRKVFSEKDLYLRAGVVRPTSDAVAPSDPDAELVTRVQTGEKDAFEELVRRHARRVYGTLAGMVGNPDDARDAMQDVFLKAFEHIGRFEGRSKFSTWLTSIAVNTGTELLRQRRPSESLEDDDDEGFRPRQLQSWDDNPEQILAASQMKELVRQSILRLPQKYRIALLLRDINQFSTEEAAAALELSVPALKARVLRGRLMLRESLAPYFTGAERLTGDA